MENSKSNLLVGLVIGAAVGAAIGYFLASDNKEKIIEELKDTANNLKKDFDTHFEKGKKAVDDFITGSEQQV
ncbi:MAG: YtxH domain-containing protein [Bacteroidia bacterium]|nr:YtxH domain-containing protein [Bacteroidia bacterium]HQU99727.1 YtxH domain-containing protein [Bacteroidia bacterium]